MTWNDPLPEDPDGALKGARVLLVEDEFFIAEDLAQAVHALGGDVIGPAQDLDEALELIAGDLPDLAVLHLNLSGRLVFPFAEELRHAGVPFVFATGYGSGQVQLGSFSAVPCWHKPFDAREVARTLGALFNRAP